MKAAVFVIANLHPKVIHLDQLIAVNIDPTNFDFELSFNDVQLISSDQFSVQMQDQILMQFNTNTHSDCIFRT